MSEKAEISLCATCKEFEECNIMRDTIYMVRWCWKYEKK